jgi:hypothetical protein
MGDGGKPAAPFDDRLQRRDHGLGEKREGIGEVALAGTVPPDDEGRIVEIHVLDGNAAKTHQLHPAESAIDHASPRGQGRPDHAGSETTL